MCYLAGCLFWSQSQLNTYCSIGLKTNSPFLNKTFVKFYLHEVYCHYTYNVTLLREKEGRKRRTYVLDNTRAVMIFFSPRSYKIILSRSCFITRVQNYLLIVYSKQLLI